VPAIEQFSADCSLRNAISRKPEMSINPQNVETVSLTDRLYTEMLDVMNRLPQLHVEDYDMAAVKETIIQPVAEYLDRARQHSTTRQQGSIPQFVKPIFVSGEPGIGKTTLMMVLDEALCQLAIPAAGSCRDLVASGKISGYFADKKPLSVTPLRLAGKPTAALSARDWNNVLRHWTFDEETGKESAQALAHLVQHLCGKVAIVDEAEIEGYVYFTEILAQQGILVLLSSNLNPKLIRLTKDRFSTVVLAGLDHREGDLAKVCLPQNSNELFALFADSSEREIVKSRLLADSKISVKQLAGKSLICLNWDDLQNKPLMKDDFAHFFKDYRPDFVLIDEVPFFSTITAPDVNLTFLGRLSRFVNFVDAIHDCHLPLVVRGTHLGALDAQAIGRQFKAALTGYDDRTGGKHGQTALIEWTRCLSRLRSREALNAQLWSLRQR
jgi:predicted ATPase